MGVPERDPLSQLSLPPGFRFYPTDEELLVQYLCRKVAGHHFALQIIGDIDLYKFDPWVLPSKAIFGEKEWYFFSPRDRKYPNGSRPNRVAGSGYWKATGTDKVITTEGRRVGIKKALVFYIGKAPKGTKTNWIMHEYRLSDQPHHQGRSSGVGASRKLDDWVLCRIYKKSSGAAKAAVGGASSDHHQYSTPLMDISHRDQHSPEANSDYQELGTTSSSSSPEYSLPELDDYRFFALPGMDSLLASSGSELGQQLQQQQQDEDDGDKLISLQSLLGSGINFEWSTLAGLNSSESISSVNGETGVYPPPQKLLDVKVEEADQYHHHHQSSTASGFMSNFLNSGLVDPNICPNSAAMFGIRYPKLSTAASAFGFTQ